MDLLLWRHAHAQLLQPGQCDLDRRLTAKGERQAIRMAVWLNGRLGDDATVWVSPAERTQQTAAALRREVLTLPALSPDASARSVRALLAEAPTAQPLLVVGHQPTLGQLAALLLSGHEQDWSVKKGAIWWLHHRQRPAEAPRWTLKLVLSAEDIEP